MAAFDLEEQETLDELKAWWRQYGLWVKLGIAALLVVAVGTGTWNWWQKSQNDAAGGIYFQVEAAFDSRDTVKVRELADKLAADYQRSPYTPRAQLLAARRDFEAGKMQDAEKRLRAVVAGAQEPMLRDMARLRLSALLLDERKHEDALKVLDKPEVPQNGRLFDDRRGDILLGLGKPMEARKAWQTAYDGATRDTAFQAWLQLKLDALGEEGSPGAGPAPAAAAK
ncbi:MAG: tetratricopeptide repeat protein [Rhodocyclaceae bacterium]|nr:tetratricopeptide repeat protein [Rhodocyclaceae bacterium]